MPKKIRELKQMLTSAGFTSRTGKGSHSNWFHPLYSGRITIAGKDGSDAKDYLEKKVDQAIEEIERKRNDGQS
jgi:predicted RNA binding protein YcfA (HicA-like mRNA interferase family)